MVILLLPSHQDLEDFKTLPSVHQNGQPIAARSFRHSTLDSEDSVVVGGVLAPLVGGEHRLEFAMLVPCSVS